MSGACTSLPENVQAYLQWLATQRRVAALTQKGYRRELQRLVALAAPQAPEVLSAAEIRNLAGRLRASGLSGPSIARALSAWRGYFNWLVRYRGLRENPAAHVRPPRSPSRLPRALAPDQAARLLAAVPEDGLEVRDLAMFELFYSSGLRLAELAGLDVDGALDLNEGTVTVLGKRARRRQVPVGSMARQALQRWLQERDRWASPQEPALFVTRTGRRLSASGVRSRLARWARRSGLGVHVHPHMLRHSFASHLLQSSGDLRAVQELLGHGSIRSTQVYTHLDFQHLARIYDAAHPRARKR